MEDTFEQLVNILSIKSPSTDVLRKITLLIKQQTSESFSSFISVSFRSLSDLKDWTWEQFSLDSSQWIQRLDYLSLFETLSSFHESLIWNYQNIDSDLQATLLIPKINEQIDRIFQQINQSHDDNDPFISIVSRCFDNLSYFLRENPEYDTLPIFCHINQSIARYYLMTDQFKIYLHQLQQSELHETIFTPKQVFYVKTCSFSLCSYLTARVQNFIFTREEMLEHVRKEYLQIMNTHSQMIQSWNDKFLCSILHLTGLVLACVWWGGAKSVQRKILFSNEQIMSGFVQSLLRIISYEPFQKKNQSKQLNNETLLMHTIFKCLLFIVQKHNVNWIFRSNPSILDTVCKVAETSTCTLTSLYAYAILGETLPGDKLKELKFVDHAGHFFYNILEQSWHNSSKKYKQIPISYLLRSFVGLSKNDVIQQRTADLNKVPLFIEISDEYPLTFDIIWGLSFNRDIQLQLLSNSTFIEKLSHLSKQSDDEQIRKATTGILWNLQINQQHHPTTDDISPKDTFDFMISYSHKDKVLCKQLYDELIRRNYRVWIDFDQMHGNVMDAMAQAIDRSQTIIICMSEQYRKSNFCRAEAHYAFQQQRQIVPVLMQKHYKPDGWLLFLIGQLLYVDFTKYDFDRAMEMLMKELKATDVTDRNRINVQVERDSIIAPAILSIAPAKLTPSPVPEKNIANWTQTHVQEWLVGNNLTQMARLLIDLNGRSLLYINEYIRNGNTNQILTLLQEDSLRKTGETLSLTELSCFRMLIESQIDSNMSKTVNKIDKKRSFICCSMM
ncbi:hypothetical protein I4U23_025693 [Adineta vaga]|nr:hypothetical protein I4U23_025693 [Adineta vaga]